MAKDRVGFVGLGVMGKPMARNLLAADVTILMLPDSPQVREVLDGDDGLLAGARDATLSIMAGGSDADFARAKPLFEALGKTIEHDFTPGFRIDLHHNDLGIALQTAREDGVALPNTAAVDQMLQALRANGRGDRDHSALLTHIEDLARHTTGATA